MTKTLAERAAEGCLTCRGTGESLLTPGPCKACQHAIAVAEAEVESARVDLLDELDEFIAAVTHVSGSWQSVVRGYIKGLKTRDWSAWSEAKRESHD